MENEVSSSSAFREGGSKVDALNNAVGAGKYGVLSHDYPSLLDVPFISESDILLTRQVGSGSFGCVYHGLLFSQDVAVKQLTVKNFTDDLEVLTIDDEPDEEDQKAQQIAKTFVALEKEVSIMKGLRFAKIVQFYGICLNPTAIVTEYCAKGSLFDLIGKARVSKNVAKELSWKTRLRLARDAAIGMNFLHNRKPPVLHRDLKSPNLLVDEYYRCKVADFNTSCFVDKTVMSNSIQANNPRWLAPEVLDGEPFTNASDVYSFGIILWELLTWCEPFETEFETLKTLQILARTVLDGYRPEIIPNSKLLGGPCPVYDEYVKLVHECWDQIPENRPSFSQVVDRIQQLMSSLVSGSSEESMPHRGVERISSRPARAYSPEPMPSQPTHRCSPFSSPPLSKQPTSENSTHLNGEMPRPDAQADVVQSAPEIQCSPFQNGPPPSEAGDQSPRSKLVEYQPASFSEWSTKCSSAMVETTPKARGSRKARDLWNRLSSDFFQVGFTESTDEKRNQAMALWDSIRTSIFGDPKSDRFVKKFANFVAGDETEFRKKIAHYDEEVVPLGVKVLRAMLAIEDQEEKDKTKWTLVKHLMLETLKPSSPHPGWRVLAKKANPSQVEEAITRWIKYRVSFRRHAAMKKQRAQQLWKTVRDLFRFSAEAQSPLSPQWSTVKKALGYNSENPDHSISTIHEDAVEETPSAQPTRKPNHQAREHWDLIRQSFNFKTKSIWDEKLPFLADIAKSQSFTKEETPSSSSPNTVTTPVSTPGTSEAKQVGWERVRRILMVDDKPPTMKIWNAVRVYFENHDFGEDWHKIARFVSSTVDPPNKHEWDRFRKLFFENKTLREQAQWSYLKDLFLKRQV